MKPPILEFKKGRASVTDLSSQLWCEKQLEYTFRFGRKKTKAMKKGGKMHQKLHEEITDLIKVKPETRADYIGLKYIDIINSLEQLRQEKLTREMPVMGKISDIPLSGIIDELKIEDGETKLFDHKTRRSNKKPGPAQVLTHEFQLSAYRQLLCNLKEELFGAGDIITFWRFEREPFLSKKFYKELKKEGVDEGKDVVKIAEKAFSLAKKIPPVSSELSSLYEFQGTGENIGAHKFKFSQSNFFSTFSRLEEWWLGEREAEKVRKKEPWKCRFCEFKDRCWYQTKLE